MASAAAAQPADWPPRIGEPFPDVAFIDEDGHPVRLAQFKGRVLLVEMIGMTCSACNAFSGAHRVGGFDGVQPQPGLPSIEELAPKYAGVSIDDERLLVVQILLYSMSMQAPTAADAKQWAAHFRPASRANWIVLSGRPELIGSASYNLIPGFQLVDRTGIVRADSTGHTPRQNLFTDLLPLLPRLLEE
jgi:hypothetical protein